MTQKSWPHQSILCRLFVIFSIFPSERDVFFIQVIQEIDFYTKKKRRKERRRKKEIFTFGVIVQQPWGLNMTCQPLKG